MIRRKLEQSNAVYSSSIWTIMFPLVLAGIAYLIYRAPGRMRGLHQRLPQLSAALVGLGVLIVLGTLLNDSGIAIAGVMLGRGDTGADRRHGARRPGGAGAQIARAGARRAHGARRGARSGVIVGLGLVVGLLTVRLLVMGGRDVLDAPVLQRRNLRNRVAADRGRACSW